MNQILEVQKECCDNYQSEFKPVDLEQLVVISEGVYEGLPVEGVRYPSPSHMSGWWLTTDEYDGNVETLKTVHFQHIIEKRPEIAIYMGLKNGYRFLLGSKNESVWFDQKASESDDMNH